MNENEEREESNTDTIVARGELSPEDVPATDENEQDTEQTDDKEPKQPDVKPESEPKTEPKQRRSDDGYTQQMAKLREAAAGDSLFSEALDLMEMQKREIDRMRGVIGKIEGSYQDNENRRLVNEMLSEIETEYGTKIEPGSEEFEKLKNIATTMNPMKAAYVYLYGNKKPNLSTVGRSQQFDREGQSGTSEFEEMCRKAGVDPDSAKRHFNQ